MSEVLFFDSGVGAYSMAQSLACLCPNINIVLAIDNSTAPYGEKSQSHIKEHSIKALQTLSERCNPDIIVIACNSISTHSLEDIRTKYDIPIVGVVPAIKPAKNLSNKFAVLATPATIKSYYTHQLIEEFAQDCEISLISAQELVAIAEKKLAGHAVDFSHCEYIFEALEGITHTVLACTHFPILLPELKIQLPKMYWLTSHDAVANRIMQLVSHSGENKRQSIFTGTPYPIAGYTAC